MILRIILIGVILVGFIYFMYCFLASPKNTDDSNKKITYEKNPYKNCIPKTIKPLSKEEIASIHARGKITQQEQLEEWESLDLCAPGDHLGTAAWRCRNFKNCHECLEDYAATLTDEYTSFFDIVSSFPKEDLTKIDFRSEKLDS